MQKLLENQKVVNKRRWQPWLSFLFSILLLTFVCSFFISIPSSQQTDPNFQTGAASSESGQVLHAGEVSAQESSPAEKQRADVVFKKVKGEVKPNQSFYELMMRHGSTPQEVARMAAASKGIYNLRKLMPGRSFEVTLDEKERVHQVRYTVDPEHTFVIRKTPDRYEALMETNPFEIYTRRMKGAITSSLFEAVQEIGEGPELAVKFAEIFAWDVDFHFDIREGDQFNILFEEKWRDGSFYGYGKILAAEFVNQGETLQAVYYESREGKSGYYMPKGQSLQKQFLRSPLKFSRISSKFTYKRYHPILKSYRPHLGVDYVAPVGTPIHAAGDGKVIFAGRKGGNGKFVKIRHSQAYMTGYLHLSRIARGIRSGKKVKQGQVIGYVGQTGLATGPHLCYRFYKYGKFVNSLTVKFPSASPVPRKEMKAFFEIRDSLLTRLLKYSPVYQVDRNDNLVAGLSTFRS